MRRIYMKRNFSLILISTFALLSILYLLNNYESVLLGNKPAILAPDPFNYRFPNNNITLIVEQENIFLMKSKTPSSTTTFIRRTPPKCSVTIVLILCQVNEYLSFHRKVFHNNNETSYIPNKTPIVAKDFRRQLNQTVVMLKSIAIQTFYENPFDCVKVIILSDVKRHFDKIQHIINSQWSENFRRSLQLHFIRVKYPKGAEWMKKMFRPCATLRLFIPELLSSSKNQDDDDIVLYSDTDFIFLNSLQNLKNLHFPKGKLGNGKIASMAPCLFHYNDKQANDVPYYGTTGLNAGLMLMNLTRMRESMWTNKIRMVTTMFQHKIKLADQDILNIYFHFFPEELSVMSCDWNFRPFQCRQGSHCEDQQLFSRGISALHGNALSFTESGPEPLFHTVFQIFQELKLTQDLDLEDFLSELESRLLIAEENAHSECSRFGGFSLLLLNRLDRLVQNRRIIQNDNGL